MVSALKVSVLSEMRWTRRRAERHSSSSCSWNGSRFSLHRCVSIAQRSSMVLTHRIVPVKRAGSWVSRPCNKRELHQYCGYFEIKESTILDRRSCKPILVMSIPSRVMVPSLGSVKRSKDMARVDFPEPVRPNRPTFSLALREKEMPRMTAGRSGA